MPSSRLESKRGLAGRPGEAEEIGGRSEDGCLIPYRTALQ